MSDAFLVWSGDFLASPTGDLGTSSASMLGQQRVLRRLLTNPGDYLWNLGFGAGLGQFIGAPCDVEVIRASIRSQIFKESAVARTPEPSVDVQASVDGSVYVQIRYVDATTGAVQNLSFDVSVGQ